VVCPRCACLRCVIAQDVKQQHSSQWSGSLEVCVGVGVSVGRLRVVKVCGACEEEVKLRLGSSREGFKWCHLIMMKQPAPLALRVMISGCLC